MTWRNQAACRGMPTKWWFPERPPTGPMIADMRKAKAICADCPVRLPCMEDGRDELYGIWGGVVTRKRNKEARSDEQPKV
jgi:WhiB family redox-sensing transcriptional regulator